MTAREEGPRPEVVTVPAPAKLTLSLRVTGLRSDGYHLIDSEMVTLDLADALEFSPGDALEISGGVVGAETLPTGDDNLVRRALAFVGRRAHVRLFKRIPAGGGLGGGSADAAAVLRWAGWDGDPSEAAALGADVPFCVRGGRARVSGVGEVLEPMPLDDLAGCEFTLLTPPFSVETAAVYRQWDRMGGPTGAGPNDLEPAALVVEPRLARYREELAVATGQTPVLAGSGSTWFVAGSHPGPGLTVVRAARGPQS